MKTDLRSAIATLGIFASTLIVQGQASGTGSAGAGTATAGAGTATGSRVGTVAPAQTGVRSGVNQAGRPVGGNSILSPSPNTVGGNTIFSSPAGTAGAAGTVPAGTAANPLAVNQLPAPVQTVLQNFSASGTLGSITQIQGANGPIYQASVVENGVPMDLQIAQSGQILSRTPSVGVGASTAVNAAVAPAATAQAGLPVSSLPLPVQSSLQSQLGPNAQIQTVSRDDLANGSVFRVTTMQNGVPTELRIAANGTLLSSSPIIGSATSFFTPAAGMVLPGTAVVLDALPANIQGAIRTAVGIGRVNQITQQQGTNGLSYYVSYDLNGRPMVMTIAADGRILNNTAVPAVGNAAARTTGTGGSTSTTAARSTNNPNARTSIKQDQLPDAVQRTLKREAQFAEVRSVTREHRVGGDIYTIGVRGENNVGELTISEDGKVLNDTRKNLAELSVPKVTYDDEQVTGIPFSHTPVAIQNAIKAYATASDIRSITLGTDKDGKVAYDVIFYREGRRDRMIIAKDGTLRRVEQNVSPALEVTDPNRRPMLAIGDLPQSVQDTIRRQTENVRVKEIDTKRVGDQTVYQVRYETNGTPVELLVASDGRVVLPEGPANQSSNAPLPAPVAPEERSSAVVVNATPDTTAARTANVGTAAATERGVVDSTTAARDDDRPLAKVTLADVPVPVQNTARKMVGTGKIESITPKLKDGGVAYEISFIQDGVRKNVLVNKDGIEQ